MRAWQLQEKLLTVIRMEKYKHAVKNEHYLGFLYLYLLRNLPHKVVCAIQDSSIARSFDNEGRLTPVLNFTSSSIINLRNSNLELLLESIFQEIGTVDIGVVCDTSIWACQRSDKGWAVYSEQEIREMSA